MQLMDFTLMRVLSNHKAQELCAAINETERGLLGVWCAETGFAVRVIMHGGTPIQWFVRGPMSLEDAREELMGPQITPAKGVH